jgi:steroid 5-alpha reductase family enzyme
MALPFHLPLIGLAVLVPIMAMAWRRQRRTRNAGIVDLIWAASIGALAIVYALFADGWGPRSVLVAVLVAIWSERLTWHLASRITSEPEDGRYAILRERWGERFQERLFWFFQAQALLAVLLSLPFLVLCSAEAPGWRVQDLLAVLLWLVAMSGESLADHQLHAWRSDPANRGRTCRSGLWAWSRHPNYFFEWLHWLVYPVLGIGLDWGWALWLAPALMLFLVLKVTGIPPTEEQALRSRGDDYRAYQQTTSAFFPCPRKHAPQELPGSSS